MPQTNTATITLLSQWLADYRSAYRLLLKEHLRALSVLAIEAPTNADAREVIRNSVFYHS